MYNDDDLIRLGAHKFMSAVAEQFDREEMRVVLEFSGKTDLLPYGHAPIIGEPFDVMDDEYIFKLRRFACVALAGQEWFSKTAPALARAIRLPVNISDCLKLKQDENLFPKLVGNYGSSLIMAGRDFQLHPSIADCCSGLMAHKDTPDSLRAELQEFRPRPLEGLEVWWETEFEFFDGSHKPIKVLGGFSWSTPEMFASDLESRIRGRQRVRDLGAAEDYLHRWDEQTAIVRQRASECYPSKFGHG